MNHLRYEPRVSEVRTPVVDFTSASGFCGGSKQDVKGLPGFQKAEGAGGPFNYIFNAKRNVNNFMCFVLKLSMSMVELDGRS